MGHITPAQHAQLQRHCDNLSAENRSKGKRIGDLEKQLDSIAHEGERIPGIYETLFNPNKRAQGRLIRAQHEKDLKEIKAQMPKTGMSKWKKAGILGLTGLAVTLTGVAALVAGGALGALVGGFATQEQYMGYGGGLL